MIIQEDQVCEQDLMDYTKGENPTPLLDTFYLPTLPDAGEAAQPDPWLTRWVIATWVHDCFVTLSRRLRHKLMNLKYPDRLSPEKRSSSRDRSRYAKQQAQIICDVSGGCSLCLRYGQVPPSTLLVLNGDPGNESGQRSGDCRRLDVLPWEGRG